MSSTAETLGDMTTSLDIHAIRKDFPVLNKTVHGKPLVYLDNAASSQKPSAVIETLDHYYREYNANIHRGVHTLSQQATIEYELARDKVQAHLNAASRKEIIFVRGATEAINLVSHSLGTMIRQDDEIIITELEHHSNIVPWQLLSQRTGAKLKYVPMNDQGELIQEEYVKLLNKKTAIVAIGHISNALGTINPVKEMIDKAHEVGARVLVDGAQAVPHVAVDVQDLDCDFYVYSGHKLFGPTGIGVLYGKEDLLNVMPPYQGGGDMIRTVSMQKSTYAELPNKFEAGTPHIAGVIGLGAAIDYLSAFDMAEISAYENSLLDYANQQVKDIKGFIPVGTAENKASILSFVLEGIHPHDIGTIFDHDGVAVRAGHHCAMPIMERLKLPATARASFAFYNTREEVDQLVISVQKCIEMFS